jgi:hypothetical protein
MNDECCNHNCNQGRDCPLRNSKKSIGKMKILKWSGTTLCLIGIALTSFNIYPLNILIGFTGSLLWAMAGYADDDLPLLVVELVATVIYFCGIVTYVLAALRLWGIL